VEAEHQARLAAVEREKAAETARLAGKVAALEGELVDAVAAAADDDASDDDDVSGLMAHLAVKQGASERVKLEAQLEELEEQLVDAVVGAEEAEALSAENQMLKRRLSQIDRGGAAAPWVVPDIETERRLQAENSDLQARIDALSAELAAQADVVARAEEAEADATLAGHLADKHAARVARDNDQLRGKLTSLEGELDVTVDLETVETLAKENDAYKQANERLAAELKRLKSAMATAASATASDHAAALAKSERTMTEVVGENRELRTQLKAIKSAAARPIEPEEPVCSTAADAAPLLEAVARFGEELGASRLECAQQFMKLIEADAELEAAVRRLQKVFPLLEPAEVVAGL